MKIAILINAISRGGAERQALNATLQLAKRGHDVELLYYHQSVDEYEYPAFSRAKVTYIPKGRSRLGFLWRLRNHFRRGRFDVVHAFKATENIYGCLAAKLAGTPVVIGGYREQYAAGGVIRLLHLSLRGIVDGWIVNTQAIANSMVRAIGAKQKDFFVLPNGIDPESFNSSLSAIDAKKSLRLAPSQPVVSIVARLHPIKNHAMFLAMAVEVLKRRPDAQFLIVGGGPLRSEVQSKATAMGLTNAVHFLGERSDVSDVMAATDVSVLTSHSEGLSNALLESMCVGLPIVTTDYTGVRELITDGEQGFIVPRDDAKAMADKVCVLLDDADLRTRMGQRGKAYVTNTFGVDVMAKSLLSFYELCLANKR
jgi:glycosyltransferase involved in cell wall biosynthesis